MNFDQSNSKRLWRGPTIAEIAEASRVATATVDRVLNGREGVRAGTRDKVLAALARLNGGVAATGAPPRRFAFVCDSGSSFRDTLQSAVEAHCAANADVLCSFDAVRTNEVEPVKFAQLLERAAESAEGLVVVSREDLTVNRALRAIAGRGTPIVCLTTDLPQSGRIACVGSDQVAAGATAAYLMGKAVGHLPGKILFVYSAPYRGQEEREIGFRRVLRSEFGHLEVDERVNSADDSGFVYHNVRRYVAEHGAPAGVYNVAAGNVGIGEALEAEGLDGKVIFIGHELNANSRMLLEGGQMHFAIGHDVDREVALALECLSAHADRRPLPTIAPTRVRVYTKYNCS